VATKQGTKQRIAPSGHPTDRPVPGDVDLVIRVAAGDELAERQLLARHRAAVADLGPSEGFDSVDSSGQVTVAMIRHGIGKGLPFRAAWLAMHAQGSMPATAERRNPVWDAFCTLPAEWQTAVWHHEVEGQHSDEIAEVLGLTPEGADGALASGHSALRRKVALTHAGTPTSAECEHLQGTLRFDPPSRLTSADTRALRDHGRTCRGCTAMAGQLLVLEHSLRDTLAGVVLGASAGRYLEIRPRPGQLRVVGGRALATRRRRGATPLVAGITAAAVGAAAAASVFLGPAMVGVADMPSAQAAPAEVPIAGARLEPLPITPVRAPRVAKPAPAPAPAAAPASAPAAAPAPAPAPAGTSGGSSTATSTGSPSGSPSGGTGTGGSGGGTGGGGTGGGGGTSQPAPVDNGPGQGLEHASPQGASHGTRAHGNSGGNGGNGGGNGKGAGKAAGKAAGKH